MKSLLPILLAQTTEEMPGSADLLARAIDAIASWQAVIFIAVLIVGGTAFFAFLFERRYVRALLRDLEKGEAALLSVESPTEMYENYHEVTESVGSSLRFRGFIDAWDSFTAQLAPHEEADNRMVLISSTPTRDVFNLNRIYRFSRLPFYRSLPNYLVG